jgi:hypothetical protein
MPAGLIPFAIFGTILGIFGAWLKLSDRDDKR